MEINKPQAVGKGNIETIQHDGKETLTVVFMKGGRKYEYSPVFQKQYAELKKAAEEETSDNFKLLFKAIKDDAFITYKEVE